MSEIPIPLPGGPDVPQEWSHDAPAPPDMSFLFDLGDAVIKAFAAMGLPNIDAGIGVGGREIGFRLGTSRVDVTINIIPALVVKP